MNIRLDHDVMVNEIYIKSYTDTNKNTMLTRASVLWGSIVSRTNPNSSAQRDRAWYRGCVNRFEDFQDFASWANSQKGYLEKEKNGKFWQIDKDICLPFNQDYSKEACAFVPNELNCLLTYSTKSRGHTMLGVHYSTRDECYVAQASEEGTRKWLGAYSDEISAHRAWQDYKIKRLRDKSIEYKGLVDPRVSQGLILHADIILEDKLNNRETKR